MHDAPLDRRDTLALGVLHLEPCKDVVHVLAIDLGLDSQQIPCTSSLPPLTFCIRGKVTPWLSYASACGPSQIGMNAAHLTERGNLLVGSRVLSRKLIRRETKHDEALVRKVLVQLLQTGELFVSCRCMHAGREPQYALVACSRCRQRRRLACNRSLTISTPC